MGVGEGIIAGIKSRLSVRRGRGEDSNLRVRSSARAFSVSKPTGWRKREKA